MKRLNKIFVFVICCIMLNPISVHATANKTAGTDKNDSSSIEQDKSKDTATNDTNDDDTDSTDTSNSNTTNTGTDDSDDDTSGGDTSVATNSKVMLCDNWKIPTVTYGQKVNIVLPLVNMDKYTITNVIIAPVISTETSSFPFEIEKTGYAVELTELLGSEANSEPLERRQEVTYTFTARDDISTGYYAVAFEASFKNANGSEETATITTYVKAIGKKGAGSNSNAVSIPRVIVTGFETTPKDVHAGEDFTLVLHIKNTSTETKIANMKCDLEAATEGTDENAVTQAFLPKQGSSTIFLDGIGAGETKDISIDMNAKASLTQKPYVLNVKMEYEDESYNPYTSDANVSIPVLQEAKFEMSNPEIMPANIEVGSESNVMFSVYNTGKTTMYNVAVKFEAASVTGGDTYVGKIQTGETGNVDAMLTGQAPTGEDAAVKVLITYEDEAGNPTTVEKSINLTVAEDTTSVPSDVGSDEDLGDTEDSNSSPLWIALIVVVIAGAIAGGIIVFKIRKKKKNMLTENELLSDIEDEYTENDVDDIDEQEEVEETDSTDAPWKEGDDDEIS